MLLKFLLNKHGKVAGYMTKEKFYLYNWVKRRYVQATEEAFAECLHTPNIAATLSISDCTTQYNIFFNGKLAAADFCNKTFQYSPRSIEISNEVFTKEDLINPPTKVLTHADMHMYFACEVYSLICKVFPNLAEIELFGSEEKKENLAS